MPDEAPTYAATAVELPGRIHYRHTWRDPLGRPLTGAVRFIGRTRTEVDGTAVLPVAVTVAVQDGAVSVLLPPDTYRVVADLRSADRERVTDSYEVTLTAD